MEHVNITMGFSNNSAQDLMFLEDMEGDGDGDDGNEDSVIEEHSNPAQASKWTTIMMNMEVINNDSDEAPPTKHIKTETRLKPEKGTREVMKVKHALHLLSTKQMSFEVKSTIAKGKKKATQKGKASAANREQWTAVISKNKTFSEPLWGYNISMFLQAINHIPSSNMKTIIKQVQQYMKPTTTHDGWSKRAERQNGGPPKEDQRTTR
ncbi:uncharacterized protein EDB91DRAFT_1248463 [Suillus paluster]|uniref:uncharacterized protein n=1 Tax=Suillus paluster TaxID=48578 RepID=UPI001B87C90A|nr:uncharacterized protein EDB91DRAFT_1248463 [Suillus paluster]KAG1740138.1 hypothetical protein EDB91DRAFT_1248463 [Suillus paluster]